ncbi:reverse transcriptase domain-containing protein [Tanacetum coccineum]
MPKALISDRGTHFYNKIMEKTMKRYGVSHRFSTSYHPQTSGQVENTNRALKRILEKTVKDNPAIWSRKLDDALSRWPVTILRHLYQKMHKTQTKADGVFFCELNEVLMRELAKDGYFVVEVRVTPMHTEIIIRATRTQSVLGYDGVDEARMLQSHFNGTFVKIGVGAYRAAAATSFLHKHDFIYPFD